MILTMISIIMIDPEKKVILDADVLIHFIKGEFLFSIPRILDNELIILDSVESACLAYAKFNKDILASSNLRDIKKYCSFHDIEYLTTIDLLKVGYENDFFTARM